MSEARPRARWDKLLHRTLGVIAALVLLAMMGVTSVDVAGRYLFNHPLTGAFELTELLLAVLIFIGLPLATERDEHITVDLLDSVLPARVVSTETMLMSWVSAIVMAVLGWQLWSKALSLAADGSVTNTLELPLAPVGFLMAVSCLITALVMLILGGVSARRVFGQAHPSHP